MPVSLPFCSRIALLMLCELDCSSALIDVSSLANSRFTLCSVSCACCFDFSSKPFAKFKISLINHSFQPDISAAVRIGNADAAFRFPRHGQAIAFQLRHHVLPAADHALLHQVHQPGGNFLCRLLFVAGQIAGLRQRAAISRVVRVAQPQPVVGQGLPGVDAGAVGAVKVGLQAFSALQFDVRDDKIQLKPSFVAVLHPQAGVLVAVKASQQRVLPFIHQA
ncbi:hypothetical protein NX000_26195 (plasmid) [Escherichia coli]|nr:hypothetical protein [Escherichia coli]WCM48474.1 hypothetical protein NX000_26195 [Escherichia coli]